MSLRSFYKLISLFITERHQFVYRIYSTEFEVKKDFQFDSIAGCIVFFRSVASVYTLYSYSCSWLRLPTTEYSCDLLMAVWRWHRCKKAATKIKWFKIALINFVSFLFLRLHSVLNFCDDNNGFLFELAVCHCNCAVCCCSSKSSPRKYNQTTTTTSSSTVRSM